MCFINDDYDWSPAYFEQGPAVLDKQLRCDECHRDLQKGTEVIRVYAQEYEECRDCENGDCECRKECCECNEPDAGESYIYFRCMDCNKFLNAVQVSEEEEGCSAHEARPALFEAFSQIRDSEGSDRESSKRYVKKAKELYPELVASGYLGWLYRKHLC